MLSNQPDIAERADGLLWRFRRIVRIGKSFRATCWQKFIVEPVKR
jgi:hypothetical protein